MTNGIILPPNDISQDFTDFAYSHALVNKGGPSGNQTLESLQTWCKK